MTGCATVLSERRYPVTIDNAEGATFFSVHDRKNNVIHQGLTPQQVTLDAKAFPYWPAKYSVAFAGAQSVSTVKELKAGLDPWAAGNIVLGGVPGIIVDGATGAMFKLPKTVTGGIPAQFAVTDTSDGSRLVAMAIKSKMPSSKTGGDFHAGEAIPQHPQTMHDSSQVQVASGTGAVDAPQGNVITR